MKHRLAIALASMCGLGLLSTAAAQAEGRYYYQGGVGAYGAVSGTPRSNLYFSGAYTGGGAEYCEGVQTGATYEGINSLIYAACGSGTSVTSSFPSTSGRAVLVNGYKSQTIWGEERW
jgi:hypothetical protein